MLVVVIVAGLLYLMDTPVRGFTGVSWLDHAIAVLVFLMAGFIIGENVLPACRKWLWRLATPRETVTQYALARVWEGDTTLLHDRDSHTVWYRAWVGQDAPLASTKADERVKLEITDITDGDELLLDRRQRLAGIWRWLEFLLWTPHALSSRRVHEFRVRPAHVHVYSTIDAVEIDGLTMPKDLFRQRLEIRKRDAGPDASSGARV